MNSFLLDTHLLLWSTFEPKKLSAPAKQIINSPENLLCFSSISIWEVAVKRALNRPDFQFDPYLLRRLLIADDYREIDMTSEHALRVAELPRLHKDPFDRLLVAQARVESLTLLTCDAAIAAYSDSVQLV